LRYIICTSQLLSEKITPSLYPDSPIDDNVDILFRKRTLRYWIGTGGCVIVVALLVSWTLRNGTGSKEAKARNLAALAVGLLIAVYLYAHTVYSFSVLLILATTIHSTLACKRTQLGGNSSPKQSIIRHCNSSDVAIYSRS